MGLHIDKVEDLLESIFVIYYVQTKIRKTKIKPISIDQINKNMKWFEDCLKYYYKEIEYGNADIEKMLFLKDRTLMLYAVDKLQNIFGNIKNIPKEVVYAYLSLLKGIEIVAENAK
jgi:hypothetical protein